MDMNKYAKFNNLAVKFDKAMELLDQGNGWDVFAGIEKGETTVKVIHDGTRVRFESTKKKRPRRVPKKEPEPDRAETPEPEPEEEFEVVELEPIEGKGNTANISE